MKFHLFKCRLRLVVSSNIYDCHTFLAGKSQNFFDVSNRIELHSFRASSHRSPFSNATNTSAWEATSSPLPFVAFICIKSPLVFVLSSSSQWNIITLRRISVFKGCLPLPASWQSTCFRLSKFIENYFDIMFLSSNVCSYRLSQRLLLLILLHVHHFRIFSTYHIFSRQLGRHWFHTKFL